MLKKNKKKNSKPVPVPKTELSPQERLADYKKTAVISNLGIAVFSGLYIIGLYLPYFYTEKITSGEITGSISAMAFFKMPLVYQGAMALICSLSILSIILEKSFIWILFTCALICTPEYSYHLVFTSNELIYASESLSVFGVGYVVLAIAMPGVMFFMAFHQFNESY